MLDEKEKEHLLLKLEVFKLCIQKKRALVAFDVAVAAAAVSDVCFLFRSIDGGHSVRITFGMKWVMVFAHI